MSNQGDIRVGRFAAFQCNQEIVPDPGDEIECAASYRERHAPDELIHMFSLSSIGTSPEVEAERRVILRALTKNFGNGVRVGCGVSIRHPETFEIGDGVFIGDHAMLHGQMNGRFVIGQSSWLGPKSYFDARDLILGEFVGWAPGAKALGSEHIGEPIDIPMVQTDIEIKPVRIGEWSDVGVNAVIMPGVTIGKGAIIGAGAVVTTDIPPMTKAAGVPARIIGSRGDGGA